jgi:DNA-binding beta-propeller fold protein YncE
MVDRNRAKPLVRLAAVALFTISAGVVYSQAVKPTNSLPDPYAGAQFGKLPDGRTWGSTAGIAVDPDGKSVWVAERCGSFLPPSRLKPGDPIACEGSNLDPILKFDETGKLVKSFGAGMLVFPHGLSVDRDGNVWVTDLIGKNGKGQQAIKFSPDGKELMRLGKAGVAGSGNDEFNAPSAALVAPNGDIFVADGHGVINKAVTNDRIAKFSKDGKFIKAWSKHGPAAGELDTPHKLAIDSQNRLFVADRVNSRIQLFDLDGRLLTEWKQFGRPSSVWIDKNDVIYVADSQSDEKTNPGFKQGIRIGSAKDGKVTAFIPADAQLGSAEEVAADDQGNVFAGFTNPKVRQLKKYVKN